MWGTEQSAQKPFRLGVNMELIYRSEEVSDSLNLVISLRVLLKFTQISNNSHWKMRS